MNYLVCYIYIYIVMFPGHFICVLISTTLILCQSVFVCFFYTSEQSNGSTWNLHSVSWRATFYPKFLLITIFSRAKPRQKTSTYTINWIFRCWRREIKWKIARTAVTKHWQSKYNLFRNSIWLTKWPVAAIRRAKFNRCQVTWPYMGRF